MSVDWMLNVALLVVLLYVAYQIHALPRRVDKRLRALAVDYKNWASTDESYWRTIKELLKDKRANLVKIGRIEAHCQRAENLFRGMDAKQADKLHRAQLQESGALDLGSVSKEQGQG